MAGKEIRNSLYEIARKYRPEDTQVLYNKNYLEGVLGIGSPEKKEIAIK